MSPHGETQLRLSVQTVTCGFLVAREVCGAIHQGYCLLAIQVGTPKIQNPQTNLLKTHKKSAATKNQKPIPNKPAQTQTSLFRHPQNLSILFVPGCWRRWEICFSSMAVAQRRQKPTNNPSNKKKPNKSKSNNGNKKKAQVKKSQEKVTVATAAELDGFTMVRMLSSWGFDLGIGLLWYETVLH